MRYALTEAGVPCPAFFAAKTEGELREAFHRIAGPAIVKPVDFSGSRGVTKVICREDLPAVLEHAMGCSRVKTVVVEAFLEGREFSVETEFIDVLVLGCLAEHG